MSRLLILTTALGALACHDDDGGSGEQSRPADAGAADASGLDARPADAAPTPDAAAPDPDAALRDPDVARPYPDGAVADPDAAPADDCVGLCEYLEGCGGCFQDEQGECLDIAGCAEVCREATPPGAAACVAALPGCDEEAYGACFDDNIGDDDCANTCRVLEACDQCFTDDDEECLSLAACAVICRDVTPPAVAGCIALVGEDCDAIDGCWE